jgi:hypothetical protein
MIALKPATSALAAALARPLTNDEIVTALGYR